MHLANRIRRSVDFYVFSCTKYSQAIRNWRKLYTFIRLVLFFFFSFFFSWILCRFGLFLESHHSDCMCAWIDVKFDWITNFEIDAGLDLPLASHSNHLPNVLSALSKIRLLMHSRQNYKQKQFGNGENEASNEKFIAFSCKIVYHSVQEVECVVHKQRRNWKFEIRTKIMRM